MASGLATALRDAVGDRRAPSVKTRWPSPCAVVGVETTVVTRHDAAQRTSIIDAPPSAAAPRGHNASAVAAARQNISTSVLKNS